MGYIVGDTVIVIKKSMFFKNTKTKGIIIDILHYIKTDLGSEYDQYFFKIKLENGKIIKIMDKESMPFGRRYDFYKLDI